MISLLNNFINVENYFVQMTDVANRYISTARIRRKSVGNESPKLNNYMPILFSKIHTHTLHTYPRKPKKNGVFRNTTRRTGDDFYRASLLL